MLDGTGAQFVDSFAVDPIDGDAAGTDHSDCGVIGQLLAEAPGIDLPHQHPSRLRLVAMAFQSGDTATERPKHGRPPSERPKTPAGSARPAHSGWGSGERAP